jgi:hypothetical protein
MAQRSDPLNPTLADIMRQRSAQPGERNQIAEQMLPPTVSQRMQPFTQRLEGLQSGLEDVAGRAYEASLPARLRDIYQSLQAGAAPEDLAGPSFDAAVRMMEYGGFAGMPRNALGTLTLRRTSNFEKPGPFGRGYIERSFSMHDSSGKDVGNVIATYDPYERNLHIEWMGTDLPTRAAPGSRGVRANPHSFALGPGELHSLGPEIQREFPMAKTITFQRDSGVTALGKEGPARTIKRQLPWAEDEGWVPKSLLRGDKA